MNNSASNPICKFLRIKRRSLDLTQQTLADKANIKRVNYARYELGGEFSVTIFAKLLDALDSNFSEYDSFYQEWRKEEKIRLDKLREKENFERLMAENEEFLSRYNL